MGEPLYPALYQINTRVWLTERSRAVGRPAKPDDMLDAELDRLAWMGFDWVWLLCVWRTGAAGQRASRANPEWRHEFEATLPDLREEDIAGPGFAITGYTVHPSLGGDVALARLRERLRQRGLRLMLDFVPNHTAMDHPWAGSEDGCRETRARSATGACSGGGQEAAKHPAGGTHAGPRLHGVDARISPASGL